MASSIPQLLASLKSNGSDELLLIETAPTAEEFVDAVLASVLPILNDVKSGGIDIATSTKHATIVRRIIDLCDNKYPATQLGDDMRGLLVTLEQQQETQTSNHSSNTGEGGVKERLLDLAVIPDDARAVDDRGNLIVFSDARLQKLVTAVGYTPPVLERTRLQADVEVIFDQSVIDSVRDWFITPIQFAGMLPSVNSLLIAGTSGTGKTILARSIVTMMHDTRSLEAKATRAYRIASSTIISAGSGSVQGGPSAWEGNAITRTKLLYSHLQTIRSQLRDKVPGSTPRVLLIIENVDNLFPHSGIMHEMARAMRSSNGEGIITIGVSRTCRADLASEPDKKAFDESAEMFDRTIIVDLPSRKQLYGFLIGRMRDGVRSGDTPERQPTSSALTLASSANADAANVSSKIEMILERGVMEELLFDSKAREAYTQYHFQKNIRSEAANVVRWAGTLEKEDEKYLLELAVRQTDKVIRGFDWPKLYNWLEDESADDLKIAPGESEGKSERALRLKNTSAYTITKDALRNALIETAKHTVVQPLKTDTQDTGDLKSSYPSSGFKTAGDRPSFDVDEDAKFGISIVDAGRLMDEVISMLSMNLLTTPRDAGEGKTCVLKSVYDDDMCAIHLEKETELTELEQMTRIAHKHEMDLKATREELRRLRAAQAAQSAQAAGSGASGADSGASGDSGDAGGSPPETVEAEEVLSPEQQREQERVKKQLADQKKRQVEDVERQKRLQQANAPVDSASYEATKLLKRSAHERLHRQLNPYQGSQDLTPIRSSDRDREQRAELQKTQDNERQEKVNQLSGELQTKANRKNTLELEITKALKEVDVLERRNAIQGDDEDKYRAAMRDITEKTREKVQLHQEMVRINVKINQLLGPRWLWYTTEEGASEPTYRWTRRQLCEPCSDSVKRRGLPQLTWQWLNEMQEKTPNFLETVFANAREKVGSTVKTKSYWAYVTEDCG